MGGPPPLPRPAAREDGEEAEPAALDPAPGLLVDRPSLAAPAGALTLADLAGGAGVQSGSGDLTFDPCQGKAMGRASRQLSRYPVIVLDDGFTIDGPLGALGSPARFACPRRTGGWAAGQNSSALWVATWPYQRPLSLRVRRPLAKSTYTRPKRWAKPSDHSKLSSRVQAW